jgi:hypothetical protein
MTPETPPPASVLNFVVLDRTTWQKGCLTRCAVNGIRCYVRENRQRHEDILELCCADEHWTTLAQLVRWLDPHQRQVCYNRNFTRIWAEFLFEQKARNAR